MVQGPRIAAGGGAGSVAPETRRPATTGARRARGGTVARSVYVGARTRPALYRLQADYFRRAGRCARPAGFARKDRGGSQRGLCGFGFCLYGWDWGLGGLMVF